MFDWPMSSPQMTTMLGLPSGDAPRCTAIDEFWERHGVVAQTVTMTTATERMAEKTAFVGNLVISHIL